MKNPARFALIFFLLLFPLLAGAHCQYNEGAAGPVRYADLSLVPVPDGAKVDRLIAVNTGFGRVEESHFAADGDPHKTMVVPMPVYLIERQGKYLLVDTGLAGALATDPSRYLGRAAACLARNELKRLVMRPGWDVPAQVLQLNIDPGKITDVVITHSHFDHTGANRAFLHATFHLTPDELRAGRSGGMLGGYISDDFPGAMTIAKLDFAGTKPLLAFEGSVDLYGDGSVYLLPLPGHSPGAVGVLVRTQHGLVLLVGDAAYTLHNIEKPVLMGVYIDADICWDTLCRLKRLSVADPEVLIWPSHDSQVFEEQPTAPDAL